MPRFGQDGHDMAICQGCGGDFDTGRVNMMTWGQGRGNLCPHCVRPAPMIPPAEMNKDPRPMSLYEYARLESGLTGAALDRYINRHYGHG